MSNDIPNNGASAGGAPAAGPSPQGASPEPSRKGPRRRKPLLIALAALALAAAAAVAVWAALGVPAAPSASSADSVVLKDNVVIYDESDPAFEILAADEDSVTVSSADALPEGSVLAVGVTEATPYGLLRTVGAAEPVEGGWRIPTAQAALTDAIESCDVHYTVSMTEAGEYETRDAKTGETVMVAPAWAGEELDNLIDYDGKWYKVQAGNEVDLKLRIEQGKVVFIFEDHVYAKAEVDWSKELEVEAHEAGASKGDEDEIELFSKNLKPFTVNVGGLPLVFKNEFTATFSGSGGVSADLFRAGAVLDKTFGFKYTSDDGFIGIQTDESQSPGLEIEPNGPALSAEGDADIEFALTSLLYDVCGIRGSAAVETEFGVKAELVEASSDDEPGVFQIPGTQLGAKGTFDAQSKVPLKLDLYAHLPFNIFDGKKNEMEGSINLFDTDDAIMLFDVHLPEKDAGGEGVGGGGGGTIGDDEEAGGSQAVELTQTYTTAWQDVNAITFPAFTFSYPSGWSVVEEDVSQASERVVLENADGARIVFSHLPKNPGGLGRFMNRYDIAPIAGSSFVAEPIQATDYSGLGDFMVARLMCTGSLFMDEDSDYQPVEDARPMYAVLPASWTGEADGLMGTPDVQFGFEYGDLIAFWGGTSESGDTDRETAEIIATLSSFRVA